MQVKPSRLCDLITRSAFLSCCVFSWASKDDVWNNLLRKDKLYLHNVRVMERHPNLQPKMRAILLDWLIEVCEREMGVGTGVKA